MWYDCNPPLHFRFLTAKLLPCSEKLNHVWTPAVLTYWQKTHLKTPLIYLQHCHVDEYSGSVCRALDFRYNWSCLVRVSCVCASTQLCRAEHLATNPKNVWKLQILIWSLNKICTFGWKVKKCSRNDDFFFNCKNLKFLNIF